MGIGLENMKSKYDKWSGATQTEPFEPIKESGIVGQTPPADGNYYQTENTVSPFDAEKLAKEDQLVNLAKDKTVTSKMSTIAYDPSKYAPLNLPGGDQDLDLGVNPKKTSLGQRGGKYDEDGPHRS